MDTHYSDPILIEVGTRIRATRVAAGLNLQHLARLTGVSIGALSQIETGRRDLRLTTLARIAAALRQPPAAFFAPSAESPAEETGAATCGYDLGDYE